MATEGQRVDTACPHNSQTASPLKGCYSSKAVSTFFYSQCSLKSIPTGEADDALTHSRNWHRDWWRQERFKVPDITPTNNKKRRIDDESGAGDSKRKCDESQSRGAQNTSEDGDSAAISSLHLIPEDDISSLKNKVLQELKLNGHDVKEPSFLQYLSMLSELYTTSSASKNCQDKNAAAGAWVTLNKPHFQECLGRHPETGEYMYTLGRMCFDMFPRGDLKCCIKGTFNIIGDAQEEIENEGLTLPKNLQKEDLSGVMTYNISVAFTMEGTNMQALLTNYGYMLPDPHIPNRFSIWFSRGILEPDPQDDNTDSEEEWKATFGDMRRSWGERAKLLAARVLLGIRVPEKMEEDGTMEYSFMRPIRAHCDVLYMDDTLRIIKGHHGSIYVLYRIS